MSSFPFPQTVTRPERLLSGAPLPELTPADHAIYDWQMLVEGFGETGQRRLKGATVMISRCGGLGGMVALELAAAGVGRLILATGGVLLPSDLNRQVLQTHANLGRPRVESILERLNAFKADVKVEVHPENMTEARATDLAREADVIVDSAPLFNERYAMNRAAVELGKPMVECAMFAMEGYVTTVLPGRTPCLACLYPDPPPTWTRRFPVLGAVSGTVGCLGAVEVIKLLSGLGETLAGRFLTFDLGTMAFRVFQVHRNLQCRVCGANSEQ